jgi:hypothetical protein
VTRINKALLTNRSGGLLYTAGKNVLNDHADMDFVLDQSAHLFTFSLSANHHAGNEKFTPRRARKYCRLLGLP